MPGERYRDPGISRLVELHLLDRAEYAPEADVKHWVMTTARTEPAWEPRRYWRGPVWVIMNWFIIEGLCRYGYEDLSETIRQDTLALVDSSGFREYYDPRDGSGCGSSKFFWTAAPTLVLSCPSDRSEGGGRFRATL